MRIYIALILSEAEYAINAFKPSIDPHKISILVIWLHWMLEVFLLIF